MRFSFFLIICFVLLSCKKEDPNADSYHKGNLTIVTDDSFKSVTEALADAYMIGYPDTKLTVKVQKEDLNLNDLINKKEKLVVLSKELSPTEIKTFEDRFGLKYTPAKFAADAVLFVVPKSSTREFLTMEEIQNGLVSDDKSFVFDGTNSSNLNFVAQKLNKKPSELKFSIISGNQNLANELDKYPNKIGVISLNTISRSYDKTSKELLEKVKVLPLRENNKLIAADTHTLRTMEYPFTRVLYFLTTEGNFSIANGFIRYSCTQIGQLVVEKEGLQPYNIYKREVKFK